MVITVTHIFKAVDDVTSLKKKIVCNFIASDAVKCWKLGVVLSDYALIAIETKICYKVI